MAILRVMFFHFFFTCPISAPDNSITWFPRNMARNARGYKQRGNEWAITNSDGRWAERTPYKVLILKKFLWLKMKSTIAVEKKSANTRSEYTHKHTCIYNRECGDLWFGVNQRRENGGKKERKRSKKEQKRLAKKLNHTLYCLTQTEESPIARFFKIWERAVGTVQYFEPWLYVTRSQHVPSVNFWMQVLHDRWWSNGSRK